jgi:hypothetical protein
MGFPASLVTATETGRLPRYRLSKLSTFILYPRYTIREYTK